jgi:hypothetical protein
MPQFPLMAGQSPLSLADERTEKRDRTLDFAGSTRRG